MSFCSHSPICKLLGNPSIHNHCTLNIELTSGWVGGWVGGWVSKAQTLKHNNRWVNIFFCSKNCSKSFQHPIIFVFMSLRFNFIPKLCTFKMTKVENIKIKIHLYTPSVYVKFDADWRTESHDLRA